MTAALPPSVQHELLSHRFFLSERLPEMIRQSLESAHGIADALAEQFEALDFLEKKGFSLHPPQLDSLMRVIYAIRADVQDGLTLLDTYAEQRQAFISERDLRQTALDCGIDPDRLPAALCEVLGIARCSVDNWQRQFADRLATMAPRS